MSEPIVFISQQQIKEGQLEAYKEYYRQVAAWTEATKPGTLAHLSYVNDEGTQATVVHVFPDAEAMERHMFGVAEIAKKASEFSHVVGFEIYGQPSEAVLKGMMQIAGTGVTLSIKPRNVGGYMRLKAGGV